MSYAHIPSALHGGGGHGGGHHGGGGGGHHGGHGGGFRGRGGYFGPPGWSYYYDSGPLLLVSDEPEGATAWVQSGGRWQPVAKLAGGPDQVQTAAKNMARQMKKQVGLSAPGAAVPSTFVNP